MPMAQINNAASPKGKTMKAKEFAHELTVKYGSFKLQNPTEEEKIEIGKDILEQISEDCLVKFKKRFAMNTNVEIGRIVSLFGEAQDWFYSLKMEVNLHWMQEKGAQNLLTHRLRDLVSEHKVNVVEKKEEVPYMSI